MDYGGWLLSIIKRRYFESFLCLPGVLGILRSDCWSPCECITFRSERHSVNCTYRNMSHGYAPHMRDVEIFQGKFSPISVAERARDTARALWQASCTELHSAGADSLENEGVRSWLVAQAKSAEENLSIQRRLGQWQQMGFWRKRTEVTFMVSKIKIWSNKCQTYS